MSVSIPHSYIDQLISENWVEYSEKALSGMTPPEMLQGKSFQDVISSSSSNNRTRAKELFEIGVLRGLLIKPRSSSIGTALGWELVLGNSHVHTSLGYISYVIGKGLKAYQAGELPESLRKALSSISVIFLLQLGLNHNGKHLLIAGLFKYILDHFRKPTDVEEAKWQRYVAAAMFCTLHDNQHSEALLEAYIQNQPIVNLVLVENKRVDEVDPETLSAMARETRSLTKVTPPKAALFWIGDYKNTSPRGIYSMSLEQGADLLSHACILERESLLSGGNNPFEALLDKSHDAY